MTAISHMVIYIYMIFILNINKLDNYISTIKTMLSKRSQIA